MTQEATAEVTEAPASGKTKDFTLIRHIVAIRREAMTEIADTVYDHELEILEAVEEEGAVTVVETYEVSVPDFDVAMEYERLQVKYKKRDPEIVRKIYGRTPAGLAEVTGAQFRPLAATKYVEPQSAVVEHENPAIKRVIKKAAPKAPPAKKKTAR